MTIERIITAVQALKIDKRNDIPLIKVGNASVQWMSDGINYEAWPGGEFRVSTGFVPHIMLFKDNVLVKRCMSIVELQECLQKIESGIL